MNYQKSLILPVLVVLVFCIAATPAWAGRVNQGSSGLGDTSCIVAAGSGIGGTPWVDVLSNELDVGTWAGPAAPSCPPSFNGTLTTLWDLFDVSTTAGDNITLVVNDPAKNWGVFDVSAGAFSGDTTCGDPTVGGITFTNCVDSADGTVFEDASASGGIAFYTDPGALQYISETDLSGKVTLLYGQFTATTPEPSSAWLLLAVVAITVATLSRRRAVAIRRSGQ